MNKTLETRILIASVLFYVACYLFFYPPIYAFRDEASYLTMSYLYRHGQIGVDLLQFPLTMTVLSKGRMVCDYPPGQSLFLSLFTWLHWRVGFLAGLTAHLVGFFFFCKLLKRFGVSTFFAILYLFFPSFVFFSRTIMSDIPSMTLLLAAYYFYDSYKIQNKALSGTLFGISLFFRLSNVIPAAVFGLFLTFRSLRQRQWRPWLAFSIPIAIAFLLQGYWNNLVFGSPFSSGRAPEYTGLILFSWNFIGGQLMHYLPSLLIMYPFMLLSPLLATKTRTPESLCAILAVFLLYGFYYFHDTFARPLWTSIFGIRFLFPILPFFLLYYSEAMERLLKKCSFSIKTAFQTSLVVILLVSNFAVNMKHQRVLAHQAELKDLIYENTESDATIIYDLNTLELLQGIWGKRRYILSQDAMAVERAFQSASSENTYVVTRDVTYGQGIEAKGLSNELKFMIDQGRLQLLTEKGRVQIYRLTESPQI